jgi:hypothetical protein
MIPAAERLPEGPELVANEEYFVVHAPRQTGKTTTLQALAAGLTAGGGYAALHVLCGAVSAAGDDYGAASRDLLDGIRTTAEDLVPAELRPPPWPEASAGQLIRNGLRAWAAACPRPLVLFLDEIDALEGTTLVSVLSQLRDGYSTRPAPFPQSIALCGLRDVRDYKVASGSSPEASTGASPFNIVQSLRLGDFTLDEVRDLYEQHTRETGQVFTEEAVDQAYRLAAGQPWLVNALAAEIVDRMKVAPAEPVTVEHVNTARERVIQARPSHLDSLVRKLREPPVLRVLEPVLAGTREPVDMAYSDDRSYARDLGLVTETPDGGLRIANPIYTEVISRALTENFLRGRQGLLPSPRDFVLPDGRFDVPGMLTALAAFWRNNESMIKVRRPFREAAAHLFLFTWLDRAVYGDGDVTREYATGDGRADLFLRWRYSAPDGTRAEQREAFEVKTRRPRDADPVNEAMDQLDRYLSHLGLSSGHLVVFDQRPQADPPAGGPLTTRTSPAGHALTIAVLTAPPSPPRKTRASKTKASAS